MNYGEEWYGMSNMLGFISSDMDPAFPIRSPVPIQSYRSRSAGSDACSASDTETFVCDPGYFPSFFFYNPVDPWSFRAYSHTLPTPCAFFFIDKYLDHKSNILNSYISDQTK
jgi:hypothetical protein